MGWSSLRFSDCQRVALKSLVLDDHDLRGVVWRSKASVSGIAFGLITCGILSFGPHNWVWKFLHTLDGILSQNGASEIDFLLPHCTESEISFPLAPMDYPRALFFLRQLIHCSWQRSNPMSGLDLNYTLHSLKATLLSWGPQISSSTCKEQRLQQSRHADPEGSLATYSRDNVWGALEFQRQVGQRIWDGWRFKIAQHRGAQCPLVEPQVSLEKFRKNLPEASFQWFTFRPDSEIIPESADIQESSDDSSSSDSSSSSASASPAPKRKKPLPSQDIPEDLADEVLIGQYRSVLHAMVRAPDNAPWRPQYDGIALKPACGRAMRASEARIVDHVDDSIPMCQHGACRKVWNHMRLA